jgi:hypothetical protein
MFKSLNTLIKAIIFTVPVLICLYSQQVDGQEKREVEIKIIRQDAHEIVSEAKVNHRSEFLLTTVSSGVMITAPKYKKETIDDMVILMEALGLYGAGLLPEGHPAAIPNDLREYAQNKFIQSLDHLDKIGNYPELYLLSGIKFINIDGKSEQFFVQTSVLAGGTSLFTAHYSPQNIKLMGKLMRAIGWQTVALFPANQHPRVPAHLSNELILMLEESQITLDDSHTLRTLLVSPDYLSAQGI